MFENHAERPRRAVRDLLFPEFRNGVTPGRMLYAATGLGPIAGAMSRSSAHVAEGAGLVRRLAEKAISPVTGATVDLRNGAPEVANGARRHFGVWLLATLAAASFSAASFHGSDPRMGLLLLALVPALASWTAEASYVAYAARTGKISLMGWARSPAHWIPAVVLTLVATLAMPHPALAQVPGVASTQSVASALSSASDVADIGSGWLRGIVPDGGVKTPLTNALSIWNVVLLGAAALMLPVFTMFAVKEAANTGKAHGGKWNGYYGPVKIALGFGLLVPALPNGLNTAEATVMLAASVSTKAGNLVWAAYSQGIADGLPLNAAVDASAPMPGAEAVRRVLGMEVCQRMLQQEQQGSSWIARHTFWEPDFPPEPDLAGTLVGNTTRWDYGICGAASVPAVVRTTANTDEGNFDDARKSAFAALVSSVHGATLVGDIVSSSTPGGGDTWPQHLVLSLASIGATYENSMSTAATAFSAAKNSAYKSTLASGSAAGWIASFDYYRMLATMAAQRAALASTPPTWRDPRARLRDGRPVAGLRSDEGPVAKVLAALNDQWTREAAAGAIDGTALALPGDTDSDPLTAALAPVSKWLVQGAIGAAGASATDPVGTMIDQGQTVISGAEAGVLVATATAVGATNGVGSLLGAGGAFSFLSPMILAFLAWAFALGIESAFILPMLPFIFGFAAAVTWVVVVCEALVGASIVAVLFCRPDGDDLVSDVQRPGMMLLVSMLTRPALSVFGFIFAMTLIAPLEGYLDTRFAGSFVGTTGGHTAGLATTLVGLSLLGYMRFQLWVRLAGLITLVPDRVLAFIGQSGAEALGGAEAATGTHGAASAAAGGAAGAMIGRGAGGGGGGGRPGGPKSDHGGLGGGGRSGGGGSGGGGGSDNRWWAGTSGGMSGLSESQQASARESHAAWQEGGGKQNLESYVSYVQGKQGERVSGRA